MNEKNRTFVFSAILWHSSFVAALELAQRNSTKEMLNRSKADRFARKMEYRMASHVVFHHGSRSTRYQSSSFLSFALLLHNNGFYTKIKKERTTTQQPKPAAQLECLGFQSSPTSPVLAASRLPQLHVLFATLNIRFVSLRIIIITSMMGRCMAYAACESQLYAVRISLIVYKSLNWMKWKRVCFPTGESNGDVEKATQNYREL